MADQDSNSSNESAESTRPEPDLVAQQLIDMAGHLVDVGSASHVVIFLDGLPAEPALFENTILVVRNESQRERAETIAKEIDAQVLEVPDARLDRPGQINLASVMALSEKLLDKGELAVVLVGEIGKPVDMLQVLPVGGEYDLFADANGSTKPKPGVKLVHRAVFQRVLAIALSLASEGREGRLVGAFFVLGDADRVSDHVEQLVMNPFRGYPSAARNILDDSLVETIKEFSFIDGAFVIRGDGVVESAGTLIRASLVDDEMPKGLGARHAAAAGITRVTNAVAITISHSDGAVRVWRKGKVATTFERAAN
jgi:diadenylate cyclase